MEERKPKLRLPSRMRLASALTVSKESNVVMHGSRWGGVRAGQQMLFIHNPNLFSYMSMDNYAL